MDGNLQFLAFHEGQADLLPDFFSLITKACGRWRVDALLHGDEEDQKQFCYKLEVYLLKKKKRYEIVQMPNLGWSPRPISPDFLTHLVRSHIAERTLIFFNISENRTPLLIDRIRHADLEANILEVPEIRALAYVMNDFNMAPWRPPQNWEKKTYNDYAFSSEKVIVVVSTQAVRSRSKICDSQNRRLKR